MTEHFSASAGRAAAMRISRMALALAIVAANASIIAAQIAHALGHDTDEDLITTTAARLRSKTEAMT